MGADILSSLKKIGLAFLHSLTSCHSPNQIAILAAQKRGNLRNEADHQAVWMRCWRQYAVDQNLRCLGEY